MLDASLMDTAIGFASWVDPMADGLCAHPMANGHWADPMGSAHGEAAERSGAACVHELLEFWNAREQVQAGV